MSHFILYFKVKKFFKINDLELESWPNMNDMNNSAVLEEENDAQTSSSEIMKLNLVTTSKDISKIMTESMTGAKSLLEQVKDPLGINDSLYQYYRSHCILL